METIFKENKILVKADRFGKTGMGRGLPMVKKTLEKLGVYITVRSRKGAGSLFQIGIPF